MSREGTDKENSKGEWDGAPQKISGKLETCVVTCNPLMTMKGIKSETITARNSPTEEESEELGIKVTLGESADKVQEVEAGLKEVEKVTDNEGEERELAGKVVKEVELSNMEEEEVYLAGKEVGEVQLIDKELLGMSVQEDIKEVELDVFSHEKINVVDVKEVELDAFVQEKINVADVKEVELDVFSHEKINMVDIKEVELDAFVQEKINVADVKEVELDVFSHEKINMVDIKEVELDAFVQEKINVADVKEVELDVFSHEKINMVDMEVRKTESYMDEVDVAPIKLDVKKLAEIDSVEKVTTDSVIHKSNSLSKEKIVDCSSRIGVARAENTHSKLPMEPPRKNKSASMSRPRLQDEPAEGVSCPFEQPQRFSTDSPPEQCFETKSSSTFTINTLSPSKIPIELHPFLEDYIPVQGEVMNIPGTNYAAVVPMGCSRYYSIPDRHYSLDRKHGPQQTSFSGGHYSLGRKQEPQQTNFSGGHYSLGRKPEPVNKSDNNKPWQTSSKRPVNSSYTSYAQPQPESFKLNSGVQPPSASFKLNSGGIDSITVTPLEPALVDSRMVQPRRFIASAIPRTRNRLKTGPGGRSRGSRRRNYSYTFKRRSLDILPTDQGQQAFRVASQFSTLQSENGRKLPDDHSEMSQVTPKIQNGQVQDFVHCSLVSKQEAVMPKQQSPSRQNMEVESVPVHVTEQATEMQQSYPRLNSEVESVPIRLTEQDDENVNKEQVIQEIDDIKMEETPHKDPQENFINMLPSSSTTKINQNWMNFGKTKTLKKHSHFRQKQFECMVCNKKYNREDFFSKHIKKCMKLHGVTQASSQNSNGPCSSHSEATGPQTWAQMKTTSDDSQNVDTNSNYILGTEFSEQLPMVNQISAETHQISAETYVGNIDLDNYPTSILGILNTAPVGILNPELTPPKLEAQSLVQAQFLEEVSPRNADSWNEIMEIAEQQGIFIPSMEPVNMDQQLMDAVSSIM